MPGSDDERLEDQQFERYLRQFRPNGPEPLLIHVNHDRPRWFWIPITVGVAACLTLALFFGIQRAPRIESISRSKETEAQFQPFTIARSRDLLAHSGSIKSSLDKIAFGSRSIQLRPGEQSALEILGKEKTKL